MAFFKMGPNTLTVPMALFRNNRSRVMEELRKEKGVDAKSYVLLEGGNDISLYDTDVDYIFRQESYFNYLFGVKEPGCYGAVHVQSGRSTLFVPRLPEEYAVWMGHLHTLNDFQKKYEVDDVRYADSKSPNESQHGNFKYKLEPPPPPPAKKSRLKRGVKDRTKNLINSAEKTLMEVNSIIREDECDVAGKKLAYDLRKMDERQRTIAEKIIGDVVFFGKLNLLGEDYSITPGTPYR